MACLSKIQSAITYDCDGGDIGLLSALLINKEDIATFVIDSNNPTLVTNLTLKEGASAYKIDTVKRTLVLNEVLKVNEGAPNAFTHTATVVVTSTTSQGSVAFLLRDLINPVSNGSFVILTETKGVAGDQISASYSRVFGLYYGMSATAVDRSSHENGGWFTITMATPERVIGEEALVLELKNYKTIYNAAIG